MACRLFGAKPLPEPILPYCQPDRWEQTSVTFKSKYKKFHSWKWTWKCQVRNGGHFVHGEMSLTLLTPGRNFIWGSLDDKPESIIDSGDGRWNLQLPDLRNYSDVIMNTMASQIISLTIVYSTIYWGADQWKHQSSASLAFVWGSHRWPVNSPHTWPVTRKMFPFDDVIVTCDGKIPHWQPGRPMGKSRVYIYCAFDRHCVIDDIFYTEPAVHKMISQRLLYMCHWSSGFWVWVFVMIMEIVTSWSIVPFTETGMLLFWWNFHHPWWRHQMETFSALLAICAGNSPVSGEFPHKGQWRGALMFSLIFTRINGWVNNREAGDLRRFRAHYNFNVMAVCIGSYQNDHALIRTKVFVLLFGFKLEFVPNRSIIKKQHWLKSCFFRRTGN